MNLNIWHYLPDKYLSKLPCIFSQMEGWLGSKGFGNDSGFWYSYNVGKGEKYIYVAIMNQVDCTLVPTWIQLNGWNGKEN